MNRLDLSLALGNSPSLRAHFRQWNAEHLAWGCGGSDVRFTEAGLLVGACRCTCPEHGCAETVAEQAGRYVSCATCRDARAIRQEGKATNCPDCYAGGSADRIEHLRLASGVPWEWWSTQALHTMTHESGVRAPVERWLSVDRHRRPFLVLTGKPGTGKTHGAIGAAFVLTANDVPVWFTTSRALLGRIKATYNAGSEASEYDAVQPCKAAGCLILDDLGAERETEWTAEKLLDVIDYRWSNRKLTVITTNVTPRTAPEGSRLWSRVFGDRVALVVTSTGPDRRQA